MSISIPPQKFQLTLLFPSLILSFVFASQARRACSNIVICFNPAPTQMLDGTEEPKMPFKFAKQAARYN